MVNHVNGFAHIYEDVKVNITNALTDLSKINIAHEEGSQQVASLKDKLENIKDRFDEELSFLRDNSEWERFTIAFFGETNAGKSTIIESLRIIFNEKQRQQKIGENRLRLEELEMNYSSNKAKLVSKLNDIASVYANEASFIADEIHKLSEIVEKTRIRQKRLRFMQMRHRLSLRKLSYAAENLRIRQKRLFACAGLLFFVGIIVGFMATHIMPNVIKQFL